MSSFLAIFSMFRYWLRGTVFIVLFLCSCFGLEVLFSLYCFYV